MTRSTTKPRPSTELAVRVLTPKEYPPEITARTGRHTPDVRFAAYHPLGLYWIEHGGAGHLSAYFLPKRRGSRAKNVGSASSMRGAFARISNHEDELVNQDAPREEGKNGPVNIFSLGRRIGGKKTETQLDREIAAYLLEHP